LPILAEATAGFFSPAQIPCANHPEILRREPWVVGNPRRRMTGQVGRRSSGQQRPHDLHDYLAALRASIRPHLAVSAGGAR
jgi:hypothetical protein